jgi:ABC-2 type transport system permease protein
MENVTINKIPSSFEAFKNLFRADLTVQWRQRRALMMSIILPVVFVVAWKGLIPTIGAATVLSLCIAVALPATGLMGYSATVARDRERGVFQRLRTTPISRWIIMTSRIAVQLVVILFTTLVTYFFAYYVDKISVPFPNLLLVFVAAVVGGLSFVALGQFIVAFIKSSEGVNAAVRLIYIPLALVGALGEIGLFGNLVKKIAVWSPLGTTQMLLAAAIHPSTITIVTLWALLATIGYGLIFAGIGIAGFEWSTA